MLDDWRTENGERFVFPFHPAAGQLTLTTRFYADPAIRAILKAAEPKNLAEVAPLIEKWRNDRSLPHNFAWARPDRLWLVLPFADATRVREVSLRCNGVNVPATCFSPGSRIIYYADVTDAITWGNDNTLMLQFTGMQENQFLGPYLDYPPATSAIQATADRQLLLPRVVYDRPIETVVPKSDGPIKPARMQSPRVLTAKMEPAWLGSDQEITFSATVDLPPEQLRAVYLSAGWMGFDTPLQYNGKTRCWTLRCVAPKRFPILDSDAVYVWAVTKNGHFSEQRAIPVKWWYGGVSHETAATLLHSPWSQVRDDARHALAFKKMIDDIKRRNNHEHKP